jgi:hypothetical protein
MGEHTGWTYRDARTPARLAQWLLWVQAGLSVLTVAFLWMRGLEPQEAGPAEGALLIVQLLVFIAGAVLTLRWIYLANANARALGATDMMATPGWAVGWFFVPLANLVMPFQTMRELWKASARPADWQMERAPGAILLWWLLWLASGVTGSIASALSTEPELAEGSAAEAIYLLSDLCFIPALLLMAWLIGRIEAMQRRALPDSVFA